MSGWISCRYYLTEPTNQVITNSFPVRILTKEPYSRCNLGDIKACTWINYRFEDCPSSATWVAHWANVPELTKQDEE
jgi:hypothetical protein